MSCDASLVITTDEWPEAEQQTLARLAVDRLHDLECRWSRFLPNSEISELNHARGEARRVSGETVRLVEALVRAWHATDRAFDPTLLGTLVELGYAASRDDATLHTSLAADTHPQGRPAEIMVEAATGVVRLPVGTALDPGGLGKGLAADIVAEELRAAGATGALVEIGGDVRVVGTPPESTAWAVGIRAIADDEPQCVVDIVDGGVATSTSRLRTWTHAGRRHHHLIDPQTLQSARADTVSCTVIAGSAGWAEAFTKVAFARGASEALAAYEARSLAASITTADGARRTTLAWKEFAR
jgi:thiamine biosynthesis lipoprotein